MAAFSKWVNNELRGLPHQNRRVSKYRNAMDDFRSAIGDFNSSIEGVSSAGVQRDIWNQTKRSVRQAASSGFADLANQLKGQPWTVRGESISWTAGQRSARNTWNPWYRQVNKWVGNYKPGVSSTRRTVSRALKSPGSPLSLAFSALAAYQGYQEGGIGGAASYVAQGAAFEVGSSILAQTIGATGAGLLGAGAAVTMGTYEALEYGNRYMKRRTRSEMSAPFVDKFGTLATMRQRSLQAMRDSHLNMRSALGNEATLMHR